MDDYIIGIDIADVDSKDFSALCTRCLNCNTIVHIETFVGEEPKKDKPKICPECGVEFSKGVTVK